MKHNREKVERMLDQISAAYGDAAVAQRPELRQILLQAATQLDKNGEYQLAATKLCKAIALYYWTHQQDFPAAVGVLHQQLKGEAVKYDATAAAAIMLPVWF
ncbi:bacteriocin immunity protein [Loigolactobacillus zhaoyuanensis]|uniref:bacteriocin immunity protein n=1 Tax=Loigolactobacillus zhaoyuanensis TaxID=2486017 RepID=UPI000F74AFC5|nr:bacteriocin immunity protein [Loigolactobacillus zhaoyuanensis]